MSNGYSGLEGYFPAGSAELNSVKQRIESLEQSGTFTDNTLMLTKKEFETSMAKMEKKAKIYFLYGLIVGIVGIIITIFVRFC